MNKKIKILHIITDLSVGGAESMLCKLLTTMDSERFSLSVLTIKKSSVLDCKFKEKGIGVYNLNLGGIFSVFQFFYRLARYSWNLDVDIIQGWMYHSNLLSLFVSFLSFKKPMIVWNIRHSLYDIKKEKRLTRVIIKLMKFLSKKPACIIYNSKISSSQHTHFGYNKSTLKVIPNGFDCNEFFYNPSKRVELRRLLKITENAFCIGLVARYNLSKDHLTFLKAAQKFSFSSPEAYFILVGRNITNAISLKKCISDLNLVDKVLLLEERNDLSSFYSIFDVVALTSAWGEGFPNVLGEAMACEVPCVTTEVGDAAFLVNGTGIIVPKEDPAALVSAWKNLLHRGSNGRKVLGERARDRIKKNFSLPHITSQYEALYLQLMEQKT